MQKELSYLTPEGFTVFTSQFHRNRGTCCKSACLHCPFGYTLKKIGMQFREVQEADFPLVESLVQGKADWKSFLPSNAQFILIKEKVAGVMLKNHIVVKHVFLNEHFQDQGLDKDIIESYFFI